VPPLRADKSLSKRAVRSLYEMSLPGGFCRQEIDSGGLLTNIHCGYGFKAVRSMTSTVPGSEPIPSTVMNA